MAATKIGDLGDGHSGLNAGQRGPSGNTLKELLLSTRAELDDLRAKYTALLQQLDADAGVTDITYEANNALAAAEFTK